MVANLPGDVTPRAGRSRASSISSVTSDSSFFTNVSFPQHQYTLPSDMESEMDESGTDLHTVSKEDLYHYIQKYQKRATRFVIVNKSLYGLFWKVKVLLCNLNDIC